VSALGRSVDAVLEATVVGSFSRVGYDVRSRLGHWQGPARLDGRTVLVTGATSGIGLAAARRFARLGASVRLLARDEARAEHARRLVQGAGNDVDVSYGIADLSDFDALRRFAARFAAENPRLDVLVHNAGALSRGFHQAPDGTELTVATQVLGPFLLTGLLLTQLQHAAPGRVIAVSSGGMYTQRFDLSALEMTRDHYDGAVAYARAKRAQVVLNREWALRLPRGEVVFHAMHPGWADTPGVASSLPAFHRLMRPLLRTPDQAADSVVWLASAPEALACTGLFWHDRRPRSDHRVPWTRGGDPAAALWDLCTARTGWGLTAGAAPGAAPGVPSR